MLQLLTLAAFVALVFGSSHSEAPGTARGPRTDLSDVYFFRSPQDASRGAQQDKYLTTILNVNPLQMSQAGPNYSPMDSNYVYTAHFDNNGDNVEDISFQFLFGSEFGGAKGEGMTVDTPQGIKQKIALAQVGGLTGTGTPQINLQDSYRVRVANGRVNKGDIVDNGEYLAQEGGKTTKFLKAFDYAGRKSTGNPDNLAEADKAYGAYADRFAYKNVVVPGCKWPARVFVGARRETFSIALGKVFDLLNLKTTPGQSADENSLDRMGVTSIVLEVHQDCLLAGVPPIQGGRVIGMYGSVRELNHVGIAESQHAIGDQVSRLANPLVNELIIGLPDKDKFSKSHPSDDVQFLKYFERPTVAALISSLVSPGVNIAPTHRRVDLIAILLQGIEITCSVNGCFRVNRAENFDPNTYADLLRLNVNIAPQVARKDQRSNGILGLDLAGYPNGRRLGDDVVDITLAVAMGVVCRSTADLGAVNPALAGVSLSAAVGACTAADAPLADPGSLTDFSPINACDFSNQFPYANAPVAGDVQLSYTDGVKSQHNAAQDCVDN